MKKLDQNSKIVLKKDVVIPAGTELTWTGYKREYVSYHYEEIIAFDKDHTGSFVVDSELIRDLPDMFEIK